MATPAIREASRALAKARRLFPSFREPVRAAAPEAAYGLGNADSAVAAIGPDDGIIAYTSGPWDRLFGYEAGELTGRHVSVVTLAADDQAPAARLHAIIVDLQRDGMWQGDMDNVRRDGTHFRGVTTITEVDDERRGRMWLMDVRPSGAAQP